MDEKQISNITDLSIEFAKMGLAVYFAYAQQQGLNQQQKDELYRQEEEKFKARTPDKLTDV
jgi:hypothetical protein